ncbi:MAG: 16S rRNA (guanine(527)-N(7))-methyltransferase RsmG [Nitrospirota bacterium]|nr:16S rRNA (guanine(527)-N(7))-methyltransferase RsmG [Nitrospirota bacterium]
MEHEQELSEFTITSIRELGLTIVESQAKQFMSYLAHLITWNKTINLTAITDHKEIIIKHFIDSLAALTSTKFPLNGAVLDVGSGGGFPGIPLKIIRPDLRLVLIDPVQKKCSFLNSMIGLLTLHDISTFNGNIEQYANRTLGHAIDMVVVRALKFHDIREHLPAVLNSNGKVVLYRAEPITHQELDGKFHLVSETTLDLPLKSGKRVISVIGMAH